MTTRDDLSTLKRGAAGFTLIELLVVIAIIAVIVVLTPMFQALRANKNTQQAKVVGVTLVECAKLARRISGAYPDRLDSSLGEWRKCVQSGKVSEPRKNGTIIMFGHRFFVIPARPNHFLLGIEPVREGVIANGTITIDHTGAIREAPTPGAEEGQRRMFNEILLAGAHAVGSLLTFDPEASAHARDFVSDSGTLRQVLAGLDRDGNGLITLPEILETPPDTLVSDASLLTEYESFRESLARAVQWGAGDEDTDRPPGVAFDDIRSGQDALLRFATLRRLCHLLVHAQPGSSKADIVNSLTAKLDAAAAADDHGDVRAKERALRAFVDEVQALAGTSLTYHAASTLSALAGAL
jgi:prepilin-type N-terminal cleavage/methylation domain-containing protein